MLQNMYELDYQADGQIGTAPDLSTHAIVWDVAQDLHIKDLKTEAADEFILGLSEFNIYYRETCFTLPYFKKLVTN